MTPISRSERLLTLIQVLRRHRRPVSGADLASETGVSLRTLYRDIASLRAQGAPIEGEAGIGYLLQPGFMLPPLMFSAEEIEALVLGSRWVAGATDAALAGAARDVLAKIAAVLPEELRETLDRTALMVPRRDQLADTTDVGLLREAIRRERVVRIDYRNEQGAESQRTIWPFALAYFERVRVVLAWCELRGDFRSFRTDRISALSETGRRYPRRRAALLAEWKVSQGMSPSTQP